MSTLQTIQSNIPLPSPLEQLVGMVNSEAIEYAGRDDDTRQLQKWLDAGDFRMVEHSARSIIERQRQFRQAQQHGLPPALQQLVDLVNSEAIEYAGRDDDTRQLQKWLGAGDFRMVEHSAKSIIERQRQFRQAQQHGLPPALQQLVDLVNSEAIEYAGRDDDTRQLQKWLDAGDFRMVEHSARSIIERQRQFRQAQQHGLPPALQQLVDLVNSETIEYAGRDDDTRQLQKWLDAGDFRMVEHSAKSIIERQRQFRQAQQHGLPPALQQLVDLVNSEAIEYAGRDDDRRQLQKWLDAGDFRMVEHSARSIIERQSNIRGLSRNKV